MVKILSGSAVETVYLAGPMSGRANFNYDTFNIVAGVLRSAGYTVLNPAEFQGGYQHKSWHDYMRYDIQTIIDDADALVLLPEWEGSKGANVEVTVARAIGLPVWDTSDLGISVKNNPPADEWAVDHPERPETSGYINGAYVYDENTMGALAQQVSQEAVCRHFMPDPCPVCAPAVEEIEETILEEAQRLVHGDRGEEYGHPAQDFGKTAAIWSVLLGVPVTARQVALCMIGVKLSRLCKSPDHRDSVVDIAGYAETYSMVMEYEHENA